MTYYSGINEAYEITEEMWVVSLADDSKTKIDRLKGGHSRIILEGFSNGLPHIWICDIKSMTGTYITNVRIWEPYDLQIISNWSVQCLGTVGAETARTILESIKQDKEIVDKNDPKNRIFFNEYQFLFFESAEKDNCMSWCKKKLEIAGIGIGGKNKPKKINFCLPKCEGSRFCCSVM